MDPLTMLHERCVHIIDDEAKVRDALTLLLSTAEIESRSYGSAEEYLALHSLKEPACILLDNQLPGMTGMELLRHLVAATKESTVIMITAYGDAETKRKALEGGAEALLTKPIDFATLRNEIDLRIERAA